MVKPSLLIATGAIIAASAIAGTTATPIAKDFTQDELSTPSTFGQEIDTTTTHKLEKRQLGMGMGMGMGWGMGWGGMGWGWPGMGMGWGWPGMGMGWGWPGMGWGFFGDKDGNTGEAAGATDIDNGPTAH